MDDPGADEATLATTGPISAAAARELLDRGRELLTADEPAKAARYFSRVIGHADPALTAEAWLALGDSLFRLDRDADALADWEAVTRMPETPSTYRAWRQIAAARVRSGDLAGARTAYREADRRAPAEDKPEIASRLGWLAKETGDSGAAGRYFARSRGGTSFGLAQIVLGITVIVSILATADPEGRLVSLLWLDRADVRAGELWRLLSVTLVHDGPIHLLFNMYALYLVGPVVESIWGSRLFGLFYVLTAIAASTASVLFSVGPAVGASGAIFGLFGLLLAGTRVHHPMLDRRARAIVPQLGTIVLINLAFGFFAGGMIDNAAHVGGLVAGLWLGLLVPPGRVPTLRSAWQGAPAASTAASPLVVAAGILGLLGLIVLGLAFAGATL
jgi:membrane associated rhomboid family serine protease